jgi:hypothetical protein
VHKLAIGECNKLLWLSPNTLLLKYQKVPIRARRKGTFDFCNGMKYWPSLSVEAIA